MMPWAVEAAIAKRAARAAAERISTVDKHAVIDERGRDVKHRADIVAQTVIIEQLSCHSPFVVLAEESAWGTKAENNQTYWIVDPLDGTVNFSRDIPLGCISIALWKVNQPLLGVVYDFYHDELFEGIVGAGAWCNGKKIEPSSVKRSSEAILATGFPVNRDFASDSLKAFISHVQVYKKIRLFGSAALSLAYVACGRVDAYLEEDIMLWDVAAGIALVQAAGGQAIRQESSAKKWAQTVWSGNPFLFPELIGSQR
ncbi:MAG: hypothetical protein JW786_12200 [Desulfobacterales bacterium]|nr:hypothetical protein [Desulfobacterales bacterium]